MPIDVTCSSCQKKYRVPDTLAGKTAKCQQCGGLMAIPAAAVPPASKPAAQAAKPVAKPAAAKPAATKPAAAKSAAVPAAAATPAQAPDPFGLEPLPAKENLFVGAGVNARGPDPLGDPVVVDYGFYDSSDPFDMGNSAPSSGATSSYSENPVLIEQRRIEAEQRKRWGGASDNPYMKAAEEEVGLRKSAKPNKYAKEEGQDRYSHFDGIVNLVGALMGVAGLVAVIMALVSPTVGFFLGVGIVLFSQMIAMAGYLWSVVMVFTHHKDDVSKGIMYLFVPCYNLYYWWTHWHVVRAPVRMLLISYIGGVLAIIAWIVAAYSAEFQQAAG